MQYFIIEINSCKQTVSNLPRYSHQCPLDVQREGGSQIVFQHSTRHLQPRRPQSADTDEPHPPPINHLRHDSRQLYKPFKRQLESPFIFTCRVDNVSSDTADAAPPGPRHVPANNNQFQSTFIHTFFHFVTIYQIIQR